MKRSFEMGDSSWTFTTIENGEPVATAKGLSREQAEEAIRRAMYGEAPLPNVTQRQQAEEPIAA
jgi:hypothetical protein